MFDLPGNAAHRAALQHVQPLRLHKPDVGAGGETFDLPGTPLIERRYSGRRYSMCRPYVAMGGAPGPSMSALTFPQIVP